MDYQVNLAISPRLNLFQAINVLNDKKYLLNRFVIRGLVEEEGTALIKVDLLGNGNDSELDYVEFYFRRIELSDVFADVVQANLNNLAPSSISENGVVLPNKVFAEIMRRFGFQVDDTYYSVTSNGTIVTLTARDSNPIFKGSINFVASGYHQVTGDLFNFVDYFGSVLPEILVKPFTLVKRDSTAGIRVHNLFVEAGVLTPDGSVVFRFNNKLKIVKDRNDFIKIIGGNKITYSSKEPVNPQINDVWIEDV